VFFQAVPYLGRLACLRHDTLTMGGVDIFDLLDDERATLGRIVAGIDPKSVGHVRRILYHRRAPPPSIHPAPQVFARSDSGPEPQWPEVSVIIPTRDRVDLLSACTRSLKEKTDYPNFNAVIVDNGSTQPEALALMRGLRDDPRFRVLERPIPFNYSRLCNDGAQVTRAPMLVFLNNDIVFFDPRWLKAMVRWAVRPEIGVVGAKLLFPNRRIQHAGVVLGMGGLSGHVYRRSPLREHGYMNQLESPRETLANTAACIAVAREKFDAIGGFDADNLPVDLNDIDFCLRIAERGWQNLWTPEAIMIHAQSATRGIDKDPFNLYRQERTYFMHRWVEAIRDDRFFHPGLSLFSQQPVLA
jgi:GT2 family glycosyltransferase